MGYNDMRQNMEDTKLQKQATVSAKKNMHAGRNSVPRREELHTQPVVVEQQSNVRRSSPYHVPRRENLQSRPVAIEHSPHVHLSNPYHVSHREDLQSQSVPVPQQSSFFRQSEPILDGPSDPQLMEDSHDYDDFMEGTDSDSAPSTIKRRGYARGLKIAHMPKGQKVKVLRNEFGIPCGEETSQLMTWIGTLARTPALIPCNYADWRKIPKEHKDEAFKQIMDKFDLAAGDKKWTLQKLDDRWRNFKFDMKKNVYDRYTTHLERVQNRDKRVPVDQWLDLLHIWDTDNFKAMCTRNKTNREELRTSHTAGKQSFAQVREKKRKEHPDGVPPTRLQLYKVTHTRKDGSPLNDIVEQNMEKMDAELEKKSAEEQMDNDVHEDIFTKVMGPEGHGWVRLMGRGVSPKDWRQSSQDIAEIRRENVELRSEVKCLREQNTKHEELISTMQSQLNMLMQIVVGKQQDGAQNIEAEVAVEG